MPYKEYAIEMNSGKIVNLFLVNIPNPSEKGFYRQVVSINAFRKRQVVYLKNKKHNWFNIISEEDYKTRLETDERTRKKFNINIPLLEIKKEFNSVWDFYKEIGWEYKKKRWVKNGS